MVNSKDFNQDYNSYYRENLDDDLPNGPYQGMLPRYYFRNGYYQGEVQLNEIVEEEDDYNQHKNNIFPFIIIGFIILSIVGYNLCKKKKEKNFFRNNI
jgi:hypothetical protein